MKSLKAEVERLTQRNSHDVGTREKEWQHFQWLFEPVSDGDDEDSDVAPMKRRKVGAVGASDEELDDEEPVDHRAGDDQVLALFCVSQVVMPKKLHSSAPVIFRAL